MEGVATDVQSSTYSGNILNMLAEEAGLEYRWKRGTKDSKTAIAIVTELMKLDRNKIKSMAKKAYNKLANEVGGGSN